MRKYLDYEGLKYLYKKLENKIEENTSSIYEYLTIICGTNQSSSISSIITINWDGGAEIVDYKGTPETIKIPMEKEYTISFGEVDGWAKPANQTFTSIGGNSRTVSGLYNATILTIKFNEVTDRKAIVSYNNKNIEVANGESIQIPYGVQCTVSAPDVNNYVTPATQTFTTSTATKEIILSYIPSSLKINITSNQGTDPIIESQKVTIKYGSTTITAANGESVGVPLNAAITIEFPSVTGYKSPNNINFTKTEGGITTYNVQYQTTVVTITMDTNQSDHSDAIDATATISYNNTAIKNGDIIKVPTGSQYTITFDTLSTSYTKPENITFTATGTSMSQNGTYKTTILTVNMTGVTNQDAAVKYNSTIVFVKNGGTIKIPLSVQCTVSAPSVDYYITPAAQTFTPTASTHSVTLAYVRSTLKLNINSNQSNDPITYKASVTWSGGSASVGDGEMIAIPINTEITITYPTITGYATPSTQKFTSTGGDIEKTGMYNTTILTVTMTGNQSGLSYSSARASVSCGGVTGTLSTDQTIKIPTGSTCSVTFNSVTSYKTPSSLSFTASGTTMSKSVTYYAKKLIFRCVDDNENIITATVKINNTSYTFGSKTMYFPYDTTVTYIAQSLEGYTAPASGSHTSNSDANISIIYAEDKTGVFILHTDGTLYRSENWTGTYSRCVGIVVTDGTHSVLVSKVHLECDEPIDTGPLGAGWGVYWGGVHQEDDYYLDIPGVLSTDDYDTACTDFNGVSNTTKIINYLNSNSILDDDAAGKYAAYQCQQYTFPNGTTGHLGSAGEWKLVADNIQDVETALSTVGGDSLIGEIWSQDGYDSEIEFTIYWTSTEADSDPSDKYYGYRAWCMDIDNDLTCRLTDCDKDYWQWMTRAFGSYTM